MLAGIGMMCESSIHLACCNKIPNGQSGFCCAFFSAQCGKELFQPFQDKRFPL